MNVCVYLHFLSKNDYARYTVYLYSELTNVDWLLLCLIGHPQKFLCARVPASPNFIFTVGYSLELKNFSLLSTRYPLTNR